MKTIIITDSNCDLTAEYVKENNIQIIPFYFTLKGKEYEDNFGRSLGYKEFYAELAKGEMVTTAQITPFNFEEYFKKYISEEYSIIYIGFSSALSQTYNNVIMAREEILEENNCADITIIDTKSASAGQGLMVYKACEMLKQGKSKEEIVSWLEENKLNVNTWFTVDNLEHLKRGGRISATSAAIGTLLDVKPVLYVNNDGKLIPSRNVRGRKKSIRAMFEEFKDRVVNAEGQTIFINHGDCIEDADYLKNLLMDEVKVKNVVINYVGPVMGTHAGPGVLSVAFIGKLRQE